MDWHRAGVPSDELLLVQRVRFYSVLQFGHNLLLPLLALGHADAPDTVGGGAHEPLSWGHRYAYYLAILQSTAFIGLFFQQAAFFEVEPADYRGLAMAMSFVVVAMLALFAVYALVFSLAFTATSFAT